MSLLKPIASASLAEIAFTNLVEAISAGEFEPGQRLSEADLARRFGISRGPLREALQRLEGRLVTRRPRVGVHVIELSADTIRELFRVREALEGMAARLAAENAGQFELGKLRAIHDEMKTPSVAGNVRKFRDLSGEFQLAVFRAARNDTIYRLLKHLQEQIRQFGGTTLTQPGRAKEVIAYSKALAAAIEKRDGDAAEKIARENRRRTLELRIKMLRGAARGGS